MRGIITMAHNNFTKFLFIVFLVKCCNFTNNFPIKLESETGNGNVTRIFQVHGRRKQLGFSSGSICFRTRFLPLLPSLQHVLQGHRTLGYEFIKGFFKCHKNINSKEEFFYIRVVRGQQIKRNF